VLDTGSSKLVLLDSTCENCYGEVYDEGLSSTYEYTLENDEISYLDGSYVKGQVAKDTVGFLQNFTVPSFKFLLGIE
jgi:hypothetical protein